MLNTSGRAILASHAPSLERGDEKRLGMEIDKQKPPQPWCCADFFGVPGRIRTCDAGIRSPALYPLSYGDA
jgi:hypothetical protein